MSVRVERGVIHLEGVCPVEDAEPLLMALQAPGRTIDISAMTRAHMAVAQLLAAAHLNLGDSPSDEFVAKLLVPALRGERPQK